MGVIWGSYRGYIGIMEKKMQATIQGLGFGFPEIRGYYFRAQRKDYSILRFYVGVPLFWETTISWGNASCTSAFPGTDYRRLSFKPR